MLSVPADEGSESAVANGASKGAAEEAAAEATAEAAVDAEAVLAPQEPAVDLTAAAATAERPKKKVIKKVVKKKVATGAAPSASEGPPQRKALEEDLDGVIGLGEAGVPVITAAELTKVSRPSCGTLQKFGCWFVMRQHLLCLSITSHTELSSWFSGRHASACRGQGARAGNRMFDKCLDNK